MKEFYYLFATIIISFSSYNNLYNQSNQYGQKLNVTKLDNPYPGYFLFDLPGKIPFTGIDNYGYFLELSDNGQGFSNIYELRNGNYALLKVNQFNIYNSSFQLIDSIPNPTDYAVDFHDFISLSNGHYLMLLIEYKQMDMSQLIEGGKTNASVFNNRLIEVDRYGNIYWQWSSLDHLNILDATSDIDLTQNTIDYAHINGMYEDEAGNILISIRHFDEISLINKTNGNFIWRMGGTYCKNNQFTISNDSYGAFTGFSHQHSTIILPNGNILLFDNGNMRGSTFSRAVEYSMNYSNKTATKVWEYRNNPDIYCSAMGNVSRLPNGNTVINWSLKSISEVRPDKSVAFEVSGLNYNPIYRAFKVYNGLNYDSKLISNSGTYTFSGIDGNIGVKVNVSSISSGVQAYVQKHDYPPYPATYNQDEIRSLLPYRWVLSPDKSGANISGDFKINLLNLNNIDDPNKLVIYKRDKEGSGNFQLLKTTYNSTTFELIAPFTGWGEFIISSITLVAPKLLSPENSAYVDVNQEFSWTEISGATTYKIEISKDTNFQNIIIRDSLTSTKYKFSNLDFNIKYYWRIKASNSVVESDWSNVRNFTTALAKPKLISPMMNKFGIFNQDTIIWEKVDGAERYQLQISVDSNFFSHLINENNVRSNKYIPSILDHNTKYFWRVKALNNNNSGLWSDISFFTTKLSEPDLKSPGDLSLNLKTNQTFIWNSVDGANTYTFQISQDESFTYDLKIISDLKSPKVDIKDLQYGTTYYWRVKSARTTDTSDWSNVNQFSTLISNVILYMPKNSSSKIFVDATLSWEQKSMGINFKLQLGTDSSFKSNEIEEDGIISNYYKIDELKPKTKYWWRVMAYDGNKISEWSPTWYFTTNDGLNIKEPLLIFPKENSETTSDVNLQWKKSINAIKYHLQVSSNLEFTKLIYDIDDLVETNFQASDFTEEQNYYWRVKALSKYDSSDWSSIRHFKVVRFNKLVQLVYPTNDDLQVPTQGNLVWNIINSADDYSIQLADNINFNNPIISEDNLKSEKISYDSLNKNTVYYWRVKYKNHEFVSDWSEIWTFKTKTSGYINSPKIISHKDGAKGIDIKGDIQWEEINNANEYQISISKFRNFSSIILTESNIKEPVYEYSQLDYSTTYYIRISASNDTSQSTWSNPIEITTVLESPEIENSINGQSSIPIHGRISWTINENDHWYGILIAKDQSFEDLVVEKVNFEENYYDYSLENNTKYYCKVKTYNDDNFSNWSKTISFTTEKLTSIDENILSEDFSIYPNPAQDFLNIKFLNYQANQNITITDLLGNEYFNLKTELVNIINISQLPKGMYIIKYRNISRFFMKI